eukprot:TRINITY_DN1838_c0_g1_i1.p1 TRINITY_DN1838_c0_g1~~TRINITY_DN1838_c0_g1_i1.p1  ORF type:complete len:327 (-),score=65.02 TRINITY_DN1838_c0_g1_i1:116-1096(-)
MGRTKIEVSEEKIKAIGDALTDRSQPIAKRFRHIFTLRNLGGRHAIDALVRGLEDDSALLKHEIAYALGQMQDPYAVPFLINVLKNKSEDSMVRHEAGEALGAIAVPEGIPALEEHAVDPIPEVSETCQLALERIRYVQNNKQKQGDGEQTSESLYDSVDPAPAEANVSNQDVEKLRKQLLDASLPLFKRYRAMFSLRNIGGKDAVEALAAGFDDESALFRHEIAYVLGQMQDPHSTEALKVVLQRGTREHAMVRHEAAEALGAIATTDIYELLRGFVEDEHRPVSESCLVALDMCDYFNSDQFEYADSLVNLNKNDTSNTSTPAH